MVIKNGFNAFPIRKAQFFAPRFDQSIARTLALAANMKYHSQTLFFPSPKTFRLGVGIRYRFGFGFWFRFRFRFQFQLQFFLGWISCSRRRERSGASGILPKRMRQQRRHLLLAMAQFGLQLLNAAVYAFGGGGVGRINMWSGLTLVSTLNEVSFLQTIDHYKKHIFTYRKVLVTNLEFLNII
ncbi:GD14239 [Drosophila simulans]|uniref:GD14239 n=1 Tax=Drosophila simulans TaxID=7240 RepID=B4QP65_DROSI|nr:GD14239 [Drosophila simulans]